MQRFANLLLSPRGVEHHRLSCSASEDCDCQPLLRICNKTCFACLKRGGLPNFSIANGNWFGQFPDAVRSMTLGARSLLRPVHNSGHLVAYSSKKFNGGTSITGHVYSNRLDTPLIRTSIPLQPGDVPVHVIVLSPFNKDETIILRAKIAAMQKNYIIDPAAIKQTLQFCKQVDNTVMTQVEFDKESYDRLPINEVSSAMFTMTSTEDATLETDPTSEKIPMEPKSGGASLLRNKK